MSATAQDQGAGWDDITPGPGVEALASAHAEGRERAESGDLTGARTLLEEALAEGELRLGRNHPRLAPLMVDLATIARNVGNLTEAQNQLRRAYGIVVASAGPEHATALSIEGRLAAVCHRLGEPTEAYDWHIAEAGPRVLGAEHPAVRGAQQRLAAAPPVQFPADDDLGPGSGGWAPESYQQAAHDYQPAVYDYEDGFAPAYSPSPRDPGVYHRRESVQIAGAPPRQSDQVEAWQDRPPPARYSGGRGHAAGIAMVLTLGIAIIVGATVIAIKIFSPGGGTPPAVQAGDATSAAPTATGPVADPPTNVRVDDHGGWVRLTWADPSAGKVPFIVSGGRDGTSPAPLESVPAGRTTSTIYGLNDQFDYCFTVAAVWSSENIQPSIRTCTHRLSTTGAPSVPITPSTA